jgi:hypothetical protein
MKPQIVSRGPGIYHQYSRRRTYVTKVSGLRLLANRFNQQNFKGTVNPAELYYIQCDKFGNFDWLTGTVYSSHGLVGMDNVFIVNKT